MPNASCSMCVLLSVPAPFFISIPDTVAELCRQACRELRSWTKRYKGICAVKEVDIENLEEVANSLEEHSVESEAI